MELAAVIQPRITSVTYQRQNGIYYTPDPLIRELVKWAVRSSHDRVLDPSFGGCGVLEAAVACLSALGNPHAGVQIFGVDIDPSAQIHAAGLRSLGVPPSNIRFADFMGTTVTDIGSVDAVIGNPPYVRHHYLEERAADQAMRAVTARGFVVSRRASYWAFFVLHALSFLKRDGRLALVLPGALMTASYAVPVRAALAARFETIRVVRLRDRAFEGASEQSLLLFAEGFGRRASSIGWESASLRETLSKSDASNLTHDEWERGEFDSTAKGVFEEAAERVVGSTLGKLATVRIGRVTGANSFFVLNQSKATEWAMSAADLQPIVSKADQLPAHLEFGKSWFSEQWRSGRNVGLLKINGASSEHWRNYLEHGVELGIADHAKCRERTPWWALADERSPDAVLAYMNWDSPRLRLLPKGLDCTNTLHRIYWREPGNDPLPIAIASLSSLTRLSAELEGRTFGGGALKLEPSDAGRLFIPRISARVAHEARRDVDRLLAESLSAATEYVDGLVDRRADWSMVRGEVTRMMNVRHRLGRTVRSDKSGRPDSACIPRGVPAERH
jgi:adenine-specific DNA-methyltransferase